MGVRISHIVFFFFFPGSIVLSRGGCCRPELIKAYDDDMRYKGLSLFSV